MVIANTSRAPISHLINWIQKKAKSYSGRRGDEVWKRLDEDGDISPMQELMYGQAKKNYQDLENLLEDSALEDPKKWARLWPYTFSETDEPFAAARAVASALEIAVDFNKRFCERLKDFPYSFALLVKSPANEFCDERRRVAWKLVQIYDDESLAPHGSPQSKLAFLFIDDWRRTVEHGTMPDDLRTFFHCLVRLLPTDTQEIEGMNGIIRYLMTIGPTTSLALLCARVINKMKLYNMARRPPTEQILSVGDACEPYHTEAVSIAADSSRFPDDPHDLFSDFSVLPLQDGGPAAPLPLQDCNAPAPGGDGKDTGLEGDGPFLGSGTAAPENTSRKRKRQSEMIAEELEEFRQRKHERCVSKLSLMLRRCLADLDEAKTIEMGVHRLFKIHLTKSGTISEAWSFLIAHKFASQLWIVNCPVRPIDRVAHMYLPLDIGLFQDVIRVMHDHLVADFDNNDSLFFMHNLRWSKKSFRNAALDGEAHLLLRAGN